MGMHDASSVDRATTTDADRSAVAHHAVRSDAATRDVILSHLSDLVGSIHRGRDLTMVIGEDITASITSSAPNEYRVAVEQTFPDTVGSHNVRAIKVLRSEGIVETVYKATARPPFADALKALWVDPAKYDLPLMVMQATAPDARMAANYRSIASAFQDGTHVQTSARAILTSGIDPGKRFEVRAGSRTAHDHLKDRERRANVSVLFRDIYAWEARAMQLFTRAAQLGNIVDAQSMFDAEVTSI